MVFRQFPQKGFFPTLAKFRVGGGGIVEQKQPPQKIRKQMTLQQIKYKIPILKILSTVYLESSKLPRATSAAPSLQTRELQPAYPTPTKATPVLSLWPEFWGSVISYSGKWRKAGQIKQPETSSLFSGVPILRFIHSIPKFIHPQSCEPNED